MFNLNVFDDQLLDCDRIVCVDLATLGINWIGSVCYAKFPRCDRNIRFNQTCRDLSQ